MEWESEAYPPISLISSLGCERYLLSPFRVIKAAFPGLQLPRKYGNNSLV